MQEIPENKSLDNSVEKKQKNRKSVFILLIVFLSMINILLLIINYQSKKEMSELSGKLKSTEDIKKQLEQDYNQISAEFKEYKGRTTQFDSLLSIAQATINKQKTQIEDLIKKGKVTDEEYAVAKKQLEELKLSRDKFVKQISSLERLNKNLVSENKTLKQTLNSEKETVKKLQDEKEALERKISEPSSSYSSLIRAVNISASGLMVSGSNETITTNTREVSRIKIVFEIEQRSNVEKGEKMLTVRILSPKGMVLTDFNKGSGKFKTISGEEKEFTFRNSITFESQKKNLNLYWQQSQSYIAGKYVVEIYHDGIIIGITNFELK